VGVGGWNLRDAPLSFDKLYSCYELTRIPEHELVRSSEQKIADSPEFSGKA
jgi:hypothetical protein